MSIMQGRVISEYLGFKAGDTVLDLAELTAGTARIKEFQIVPDDSFSMAVVAVMENGAERYVTQLKKVPPTGDRTVVPLRVRGR